MVLRLWLVLPLLMCFSFLPARSAERFALGGVKDNGQLRVEGIQLVNQYGGPIQLRGMSSHGILWVPQFVNARALLQLRSLGANLFRVAMYADSVKGGYSESDWDAGQSMKFLRMGVENSLALDLYTIIDWHILEDKNPLLTVDKAIQFFSEISSIHANDPAIIYEICNEPNGDTTWEDISLYARQVIPVIRKNSPQAVILVGTPQWSFDLSSVIPAPLEFENIMYSFHMYTGFTNYEFRDLLASMRKAGLPVFVSEWGISKDEKTGELDLVEARALISYMREHGYSWANWSLSNLDEDFSAIRTDSNKLSGWTDEDLTESGRLIFRALSGR